MFSRDDDVCKHLEDVVLVGLCLFVCSFFCLFVDVCKHLEDIVLVDLVRWTRSVHAVTKEG